MTTLTRNLNTNKLLLLLSIILLGFLAAVSVSATIRNPIGDFDGDGKTDLAVFRPSDNYWYVWKSSGGYLFVPWGLSTDTLMPGDYDGDGKTDFAVFRRGESDRSSYNHWYILRSSDYSIWSVPFGLIEQQNVSRPAPPADYNGDGKTDFATFTQPYTYDPSRGGVVATATYFDVSSLPRREFPGAYSVNLVSADYDGDGKADYTTLQNNVWTIEQSTNGAIRTVSFGLSDDRIVPADYDGDGKVDIAVWRPSNGYWYWLSSRDGSFNSYQFGQSGDVPSPGDYDDKRTDFAVFRQGIWYIQQSRDGFRAAQFGLSGDIVISE